MTKAVPHPANHAAPLTMMSSSQLEVSVWHRKAIVEVSRQKKQLLREQGNERGPMYCNAQKTHLLRIGRA